MTLPLSGPMSASMINVELGRAGTAPFDINGVDERALAEVPSGVISFSDFYGKQNNPGDPYWASVELLLHCDGTVGSSSFPDDSSTPNTVTAGTTNARVSSTQAKFDQSGVFSGVSTSFLKAASISVGFSPTLAAWTAECWFYQTAGAGAIFACTNALGGSNGYRLNAGNLSGSSAGVWTSLLTWTPPTNNEWHHIALVRGPSNVTVFVDGISMGTAAWVTPAYSAGQPLCIGIGGNSNQEPFTGYIDEVRYTKDVARYTANFTPPTEPFPGFGP